jgi:phenylacetic acid degradation protein
MPFYEINGIKPVVHPSSFVHPEAVVIGDVLIGPNCYIAPFAALRGDFGRIILEAGVNIQDSCVLHGFPETDTLVEEDGHIGHAAVLHGCIVRKNALIGMNAVIMDNAEIGESSIVAACAFVKAGMFVPAKVLVGGMPAKIMRELSEAEMAWKIEGTDMYKELAVRSLNTLKPCAPLAEVEPNRKKFDITSSKPLIVFKNIIESKL